MNSLISVNETSAPELAALGVRLRDLRKARKLSLGTVAAGCELSASLLSQVERGIVVPSLNTLYALSSFYGVSLFEFFVAEQPKEQGKVIRRDQRRKVILPESQRSYELISPSDQKSLSIFEVIVDKVGAVADHGVVHAGMECVLVLGGTVQVKLGESTYLLDQGDSIFYDGTVSHQFEPVGEQPGRVIVTVSPAI